ncbi:hypothetical protein SAMN03159341_108260 [Paenibacillus sp. 1_12]|uniref:hypothetical protein n=1 Tax=Paenibacillus sp. 1_12 TaxID=1566278 RepID=UPI0008E316AB|nr:hypothetical protein [Paenibacillus sp. 1_12]SFL69515.1 hypothetical protein SAMN03159341_108260 [Paenibacillus sp. 1_12]
MMALPIQTITDRKLAILELAASKAMELPILPSGFWFHSDLRDNFYHAIHLYAFTVDPGASTAWSKEKQEAGLALAVTMIGKVLSLQEQDPENPMYGHWPLNLGSDPAAAKPHSLPVELMGCLLIFFYDKYQSTLPMELKSNVMIAIVHMYESNVYRHPLKQLNHHEAKHTALKLLLGHQFDNKELSDQGLQYAKQQLQHIQKFGFKEYGALPWHWHWIQAFICVWEVVEDASVRETVSQLLDHLWQLRADVYLSGTWVGAQSRQWPHDAPKDNNTLLDYIQFGDFPLPKVIPRLEGAALYTYQTADKFVQAAINRNTPVEIERKIQFAEANSPVTEEAHTYTYIAPEYAVGGIWERRDEYDNEQQRWVLTLPLTEAATAEGVNQLFFFHPGNKYASGDDRHASPYGEVLLHKDSVIQLWKLPVDAENAYPSLIGCLPRGDWRFNAKGGYGCFEGLYVSFYLMNPFTIEEKPDRISIASPFQMGTNGVMVEAISTREALLLGIDSIEAYAAAMQSKTTTSFTIVDSEDPDSVAIHALYTTHRNDELSLSVDALGVFERTINGQPVQLEHYQIDSVCL